MSINRKLDNRVLPFIPRRWTVSYSDKLLDFWQQQLSLSIRHHREFGGYVLALRHHSNRQCKLFYASTEKSIEEFPNQFCRSSSFPSISDLENALVDSDLSYAFISKNIGVSLSFDNLLYAGEWHSHYSEHAYPSSKDSDFLLEYPRAIEFVISKLGICAAQVDKSKPFFSIITPLFGFSEPQSFYKIS